MTNWYPYRWVCKACNAIHWYSPAKCKACGKLELVKEANNSTATAVEIVKKNSKPEKLAKLKNQADDLIKKILGE